MPSAWLRGNKDSLRWHIHDVGRAKASQYQLVLNDNNKHVRLGLDNEGSLTFSSFVLGYPSLVSVYRPLTVALLEPTP